MAALCYQQRARLSTGETMRTYSVALFALLLSCLIVSTLPAMPLKPEVVDRLRAEGKLQEEVNLMSDAHARGVNRAPRLESAVPRIGATEVTGALNVQRDAIVLLVDFSDKVANVADYPPSHFQSMLFSEGSYTTGSMRDYFLENSYGQFSLSGSTSQWLRMPETYVYYANNQRGLGIYPQNAQKLVEDAVLAADPYVDFSQFDNDGPDGIPNSGDDDGYVDALFVVHAGRGYEETGNPADIHSHQWNTRTPVPVDGVLVSIYSMEPEDGRIGVFCHEYGHVLGLPDLYDYEYDARGVGFWSVMSTGSWGNSGLTPVHFDAWSKVRLGFVTPQVLTSNVKNLRIFKAETSPTTYILWTNGIYSSEYFLIENRQKTLFDSCIMASGLVIYHVDEAYATNNNECCGTGIPHYLLAVEQADGECDLENNYNSGDEGDPFPGSGGTYNPNYVFDSASVPSSRDYFGNETQVSLSNIETVGEDIVADVVVEDRPTTRVNEKSLTELESGSDCDGMAEPGETLALYVELYNFGISSPDVRVRMTESDPYVSMTPDSILFGNIAEDEKKTCANPFQILVDPTCPLPHGVVLDVDITDAEGYLRSERMFIGVGDTIRFYDWVHKSGKPGYGDQWHLSTERNHTPAGTSSWKCGDTGTGLHSKFLDAALYTSEFISGPGTVLSLWHWIEAEIAGPTTAWDGGVVEASLDGGPWQVIIPAGGYPYSIKSNPESPFPAGTPCFSGTLVSWQYKEFDLSGLVGMVRVRFRFGTDGATQYEGWYIDDVRIVNAQFSAVGDEVPVAGPVKLISAHPNPFNPLTTIRFSTGDVFEPVVLRIYDISGRAVRTLESTVPGAGIHEAVWDGRDDRGKAVASGVYVCRLEQVPDAPALKLVLLR